MLIPECGGAVAGALCGVPDRGLLLVLLEALRDFCNPTLKLRRPKALESACSGTKGSCQGYIQCLIGSPEDFLVIRKIIGKLQIISCCGEADSGKKAEEANPGEEEDEEVWEDGDSGPQRLGKAQLQPCASQSWCFRKPLQPGKGFWLQTRSQCPGAAGPVLLPAGQEKPLNSCHLCPELWSLSSQTQRAPAALEGPCSCPWCGMLELPLWMCTEPSLQGTARP
ncbi:uncharacterized protein LOC143694287 isoform X2 [Agelaius phoeniceus]|uniref:uncharacterized protein LOC143694287 isoform X2 n=1 Tax=Agelaius phoeniceus TaxID=39638 RepID=UPI004054E0B7